MQTPGQEVLAEPFRSNLIGRLIRHHQLGRLDMMAPDSIHEHTKAVTPVMVWEPSGFTPMVVPVRMWELTLKLHEPSEHGVNGIRQPYRSMNKLLARFTQLEDGGPKDPNLSFLVSQAEMRMRLGKGWDEIHRGYGNPDEWTYREVLYCQAIAWLDSMTSQDDG